jgi:hypothetical protein
MIEISSTEEDFNLQYPGITADRCVFFFIHAAQASTALPPDIEED